VLGPTLRGSRRHGSVWSVMAAGVCGAGFERMPHPFERLERRLRTCVWDITQRCNLRCVHCENRSGPGSPRELTRERMWLRRSVRPGKAGPKGVR